MAGEMPDVTEIQGGSYLVMETGYEYMPDFEFAGKVLSTIISTPGPGVAVGDAGARAVGGLKGLPRVEGRPGWSQLTWTLTERSSRLRMALRWRLETR